MTTTETTTYGDLCDYETGEILREATEAEERASAAAARIDGGAGVITVDGHRCYVTETGTEACDRRDAEEWVRRHYPSGIEADWSEAGYATKRAAAEALVGSDLSGAARLLAIDLLVR